MGGGLGETPKAQAADGRAPASMGRGTRGSVCGESGPEAQRVEAQEPLVRRSLGASPGPPI